MKVAVIHNLRHRSGDLRELFLLRAIRVFDRFVPVQLVLVSGELTVGNGAAEPDFLETLRASENGSSGRSRFSTSRVRHRSNCRSFPPKSRPTGGGRPPPLCWSGSGMPPGNCPGSESLPSTHWWRS